MQQQQPLGFQLVREPYRATEEQFNVFIRGLDAVLNQWTALHLVSQYCDAFALQSMYQELIAWYQSEGELYSDDLEIFFENFFAEARSVTIEDDSMKEVGDVLHDMYCRCCQNDFSLVERYIASLEVYRRVNPVRLSIDASGDNDNNGAEETVGGTSGAVPRDTSNVGNEEVEVEGEVNGRMRNDKPDLRKKKGKKNVYDRGNDGWCIVRN